MAEGTVLLSWVHQEHFTSRQCWMNLCCGVSIRPHTGMCFLRRWGAALAACVSASAGSFVGECARTCRPPQEIQVQGGLATLGAKAGRQAVDNDIACDTYITNFFICHRAVPLPSAVTLNLEMGFPVPFPHFCSSLFLHLGLCREKKKCVKSWRLMGREYSYSLDGSQHLTAGIKRAPVCSLCTALHQGAVLMCPRAHNWQGVRAEIWEELTLCIEKTSFFSCSFRCSEGSGLFQAWAGVLATWWSVLVYWLCSCRAVMFAVHQHFGENKLCEILRRWKHRVCLLTVSLVYSDNFFLKFSGKGGQQQSCGSCRSAGREEECQKQGGLEQEGSPMAAGMLCNTQLLGRRG